MSEAKKLLAEALDLCAIAETIAAVDMTAHSMHGVLQQEMDYRFKLGDWKVKVHRFLAE